MTKHLNIRAEGTGQPTLLLVHGYACDLTDWATTFAALSPEFRVVALDLPGHGGSALPDDPSIAGLAEAVNAVKAGIPGPVVLVGHSLGAKVIREAWCRAPDRVAGLVLLDGGYYADGAAEKVKSEAKRIAAIGFDAFIRPHFGSLFPANADPAVRGRVVNRAASLDAAFGTALFLSAVEFDIARSDETLRSITVPMLVLQCSTAAPGGGRRSMQPGETNEMMQAAARLSPVAELAVITGSGHFPMWEQPEQLHAALRSFARKVRKA